MKNKLKLHLIILPLILTQILSAQSFTEIPSDPVFIGVDASSLVFGDVDGDGDEDVLVTGVDLLFDPVTKLYTNDGLGNYSEMSETPFERVGNSSVAFSDVDDDNDLDVLITGINTQDEFLAKLYLNGGMGDFLEVPGTPFEGVRRGSIAFADVDGDNDQDVLITGGIDFSDNGIGKLYVNDGLGNFTEKPGTPFEEVRASSIAFADVDDDNDPDVLITGINNSGDNTAKLYTNDGNGNFTEMSGTPFEGVSQGSIAFADVNGDNSQDVIISGYLGAIDVITKLYTNDGQGNFSELKGTPFIGVKFSDVAFVDVDGDNDQDVLISGSTNDINDGTISKLYRNDGTGKFSELMGTPFESFPIINSGIAIADIDGDNDQDVLLAGATDIFRGTSHLYTNNGLGLFSEVSGMPIDGGGYGTTTFADVDGDTDLDILLTGVTSSSNLNISKLYINDGLGNFLEMSETSFEDVWTGSVAFADVDGDTDLDVLITGDNNQNERIAKLYLNNGQGNFAEVPGTPFEGVVNSSIAFTDVNGDNNPDVFITGLISSGDRISKLYTNDGQGNFTERQGTPFEGISLGSIAFVDVDGDNDSDVLITGQTNSSQIAKLYTNDGVGNFTEVLETPFEGVSRSSIAFSDVDGDNDPDVLITGQTSSNKLIAKLYLNDGLLTSTNEVNTDFDFEFTLYPNPVVSDNLKVDFNLTQSGFVNVKVYDFNGRILSQQTTFTLIGPQTISVAVDALSAGSYFIQLDNEKRRGVAKFIVP